MNWRLASRLSVIVLAVLVIIIVLIFQHHSNKNSPPPPPSPTGGSGFNSDGLNGTSMGGTPAPAFQLTDQNGQTISLAQFRGQPVVLTFMYTHCPDECPANAGKLHTAMQMLGQQAQHIAILVVSTDPKGDTRDAALSFTEKHDMQQYWHYLIGTHQQLAPVWSAYHIYASNVNGTVQHSIGLYIIDQQGREQIYLDDNFTATQVATDLRMLLNS